MKQNLLAREVGKELEAFRKAQGLRQDDVARAARQAGLTWTRSVVVALEAGRRDLTIDEFARLPLLLERLGIAQAVVRLENRGDFAQLHVAPLFERGQVLTTKWVAPHVERVRRSRQAVPGARFLDVEVAYKAAGGDLEHKIGRRLELDPLIVSLVALRVWGRSLSEERDRRIAELAPPGTAPRAMQALRGHLTRALLKELAPQLDDARQRLRQKRGGRQ
jgi:transcriptional regulator with XRE-family HTH domain